MKSNISFIFVLFLSFSIGFARGKFEIEAGINLSSYMASNSHIEPGYKFGLLKNWQTSDILSVSSGIYFNTLKGCLSDRTIKPIYTGAAVQVSSFDIETNVGYITIPLKFKYQLIKVHQINFSAHFGSDLCIPIVDKSKVTNKKDKYLYHPDHPDYLYQRNITFNYSFLE